MNAVTIMGKAARKKVLLVDDDDEVARTLRLVIERNGFEFMRARNGAVALEAIQLERPDVVLLDFVMPVMDGVQLLAALREMPDARAMPVIVLSVCSDDATVTAARRGGAVLCLPKPVSSGELVAALRRVLAPDGEQPADTPRPRAVAAT